MIYKHIINEPPRGKTNNLRRLGENKEADQLRGNREADRSAPLFSLHGQHNSSSSKIQNFMLLAVFCDCTGWLVSDLFKNHIIGFPTRWLKYLCYTADSVWGKPFLK